MHILVAWEIKATGLNWTRIDDELNQALHRFASVRVLPTVHLVRVNAQQERDSVIRALLEKVPEGTTNIELVVTPLMQGRYEGYLPDQLWPSVNGVTG